VSWAAWLARKSPNPFGVRFPLYGSFEDAVVGGGYDSAASRLVGLDFGPPNTTLY